MKKYVYSFGGGSADGDGKMKDVLGGKGAGLAEMSRAEIARATRFHDFHRSLQSLFRARQPGAIRSGRADERGAGHARNQDGTEARRHREPAAGQRAVRREIFHAGHDGHHPQPRPERSDRGGAGAQSRQSAVCLRLLPPLHPDVRQRRARSRKARFRRDLRGAQEKGGREV